MSSFYFKDLSGRQWSLKCTLADAKMLSEHPEIRVSPDMFKDPESAQALVKRLCSETFLLVEIIVELTRPQRAGQPPIQYEGQEIDVSNDREFCRLLEGSVLDQASGAFIAGLANVTPKLVRCALQEAAGMFEQDIDNAAQQIPEKIRALNTGT